MKYTLFEKFMKSLFIQNEMAHLHRIHTFKPPYHKSPANRST